MKALVYTGIETFDYREVAEPVRAENDALIEISHVGICGSDMHAFLGHDERRPAPLILGHEAAGRIIEGPGTGSLVTINPLVSCGTCEACLENRENICPDRQIISLPPREGAFAQRVTMPTGNLVTLPEGFSTTKASLAEPIACGWHAVRLGRRTLHRPLEDARCLVYGGGAIGLGAALVLTAKGAREIWIAEPNSERRKTLMRTGDFRIFDPQSETPPAAVDLIVDGVGYEATRSAATAAIKPGGVIVHIGLGNAVPGLDVRRMTLQEITFIGTYTYTMQDFRDTAQAILDGALGALDWPEIRPLSEGARAFADIRAGKVAAPKIILEP